MDNSANNKRIAKNTIALYIRMFFTMAVSLYTSRVILSTLGITDYGIYNAVGGIVAMFGFLNLAMSTATQRYLTFELGKNHHIQLKKVFSISVSIHVLIAFAILILGETIGLWFFYNKINIPVERVDAALWVYQLSIISSMVIIISVPYNASIITHEKMGAFAYISILEVTLKLGIVYLLLIFDWDKLKIYAVLMFVMQMLIQSVYWLYCRKHFFETKYSFFWNKKLFKEMLAFAGWNLWGNCAAIFFTQGLNLLLIMFFGPNVNAARGVAVQVQGSIGQFSSNFQTAFNPQITKSYAIKDLNYMHSLIFRSSRFTFFLLFILSFPVMLEAPAILDLWLETVPEYTVIFLRLILCVTIIDAMAQPLMISATATGKVKFYQSVVGGILLTILPISYIVLKLGGNPQSVFVVHLCICIIAFIVRLFIVKPLIQLSIVSFYKDVLLKSFFVIAASIPIPLILKYYMPDTVTSMFVICFCCVVIVAISAYFIGLNCNERMFVKNKVQSIVVSKIRK